jgi:hypothetical protein
MHIPLRMVAAQYRNPQSRAGRCAVAWTMLLLGVLAGCVAPPRPAAPPSATAQCLGQLSAQGVRFETVAAPVAARGCGIENAVRVLQSAIAWNRPAEMSCTLASRLDSFERDAVQPAAQRYFGRPVVLIRHLGAYACRGENGGHSRLSQHALGNAIDIGSFELDDGTRIDVDSDWRARGPRRDFLRDIAKRACAYFNVVLTPASDALHHNHFHLDVGPYRLCSVG